ncbi:membrane-associated, eicosanoid/glutathione metabolism protein [Schizothecium vesticola]|uniref:Membrane-associated, eicosanoid/glutathione metabolism protein n=1 Tax=Schizothecium vesticola TaxID=314040 RepID=A0AA40ENU6_9PEZI|nr:membrane-associated, eicosanoid/glutathione metabolism protein [Schizothecium vesticola]
MATRVGFSHLKVLGPLLPVTGSFAAPFTAYFALLSARVVYQRVHEKVFIGEDSSSSSKPPVLGAPVEHSSDKTKSSKKSSATTTTTTAAGTHEHHSPLTIATRSHANFVEHVPLALVLAAAAELNGGSKRALTTALGVLLAARVLHVEFGLRSPGATGMGRAVGWWGTMGAMGWLAGYGGWLVRGYWGVKN